MEAERDEVALQQVAHLEGAARAALGDEAQHAVPRALVPGAAGQEAAQHQLAHLRRRGQHRPQARPVEGDRLRRLGGHALRHRGLAREGRDVADERPGVGLRDPDLLARLVVDEVDPAALDDEERRVAQPLLVEDLARGERAPLALLGEPGHLVLRQAGVEDLVGEVRERLGLDPGGRHRSNASGANAIVWDGSDTDDQLPRSAHVRKRPVGRPDASPTPRARLTKLDRPNRIDHFSTTGLSEGSWRQASSARAEIVANRLHPPPDHTGQPGMPEND